MPISDASHHASHWVVIANRTAAAGRVKRRWKAVQRALDMHLESYALHFTEGQQHATRIAEEQAHQGQRHFIAVGGDGTMHEVLTGILRVIPPDGRAMLGVIPMGTGGDFKRLLKHAHSIDAAVQAIVHTRARAVDVGRVTFQNHRGEQETRTFLNSTSFGLGGLVDKYVNETPKFLGGKISFHLATLRALANYKNTCVHLQIDGKDEGVHEVSNVFVTNGRFTGSGMLVGPESKLNDGCFEVSLIPNLGVFWMMRNIRKLYDGSYRQLPRVKLWKAKDIRATHKNEEMGLLDVDGENVGKLDAIIDMLPRAIRIPNLMDDLFDA